MDYFDKITDKEIIYTIMISLMKIEGHLADLVSKTEEPEMLTGGEIDEFNAIN